MENSLGTQTMSEIELLKQGINQHYRMLELEFFADRIIYPLFASAPHLSEELGEKKAMLMERKERRKEKFSTLLAMMFLNEKLFNALLFSLGDDVRQLVERLSYDEYTASVVELSDAYTNAKVVTRTSKERFDYSGLRPLHVAYMLFATTQPEQIWLPSNYRDYDFSLFLPDEVRQYVRRHFPAKPEYTELLPLQAAPEGQYHYSNEAAIVESAITLANLIDEDIIDYDTKGEKPLKGSLKKVQQLCGFQEFFTIGKARDERQMKEAEYLAMELLISIAEQDDDDIEVKADEAETVAFIRLWLFGLRHQPQIYFSPLKHILVHVKQQYSVYQDFKETSLGSELYALLMDISSVDDVWIGADNLVKKTLYSPDSFRILSKENAKHYFYVTPSRPEDRRYGGAEKKFITSEGSYRRYLTEPLVKGATFLFAAMGLVEIVYDDATSSTPLNDTQYLSPYDNLKAVRITKLGQYLLGRTNTYSAPKSSSSGDKNVGKLVLDEYRLLATLTGANPMLEAALPTFMRLMGNSTGKAGTIAATDSGSRLYVMDSASFLKDCSSKDDVLEKIDLFKKRVGTTFPAIWDTFFEEMLAKVEPLEEQFEYRVFSIKPNRDLMRLLSTDELLKDLVLRAEGHRILIKEDDIPKVKKRLEKFGYLTALEKRKTVRFTTTRRGYW